jgi:hypothetical protein
MMHSQPETNTESSRRESRENQALPNAVPTHFNFGVRSSRFWSARTRMVGLWWIQLHFDLTPAAIFGRVVEEYPKTY